MAQFEVQKSALEQTSSNIANLTEQFRDEADQAYQAAQALCGDWLGKSATNFSEGMEVLRGWWNEMTGILDTYSQELIKAAESYTNADIESAAHFNKG